MKKVQERLFSEKTFMEYTVGFFICLFSFLGLLIGICVSILFHVFFSPFEQVLIPLLSYTIFHYIILFYFYLRK